MSEDTMLYGDLTRKIIGCAMKVHATMGNGFQEVIYQRALAFEFRDQAVQYSREFEMPIYYGDHFIGKRRVDFLVEENISVELKALLKLEPVHFAQAGNYLEAYNLQVGLLINFGAVSLEFRRLTNKKFRPGIRANLQSRNPKNPTNPSSDNELYGLTEAEIRIVEGR
jgi:GxxExxY protein